MSVESAKAFCVCMMSDEDFRNAIGSAVGGSFGKKLGGNLGASLGRNILGTLFKMGG